MKHEIFDKQRGLPKLGAVNGSPSDGGLHSGSAILQRFRGRPLCVVRPPAPLKNAAPVTHQIPIAVDSE